MSDDILHKLEANLLKLNNKICQMEERSLNTNNVISTILNKKELEIDRLMNNKDNDIIDQITVLKEKNKHLNSETSNLKEKLKEKESLLLNLTNLNNENLNNTKIMYAENKKLTEKVEFLTNQIELLKKEITPKSQLVLKQEKEIGSLTDQVNILSYEKEDFLKKLKNIDNSLNSYKQWEESSNKKIASLKKELNNKQQMIDCLDSENYRLKNDINKVEGKKPKKNIDEMIKKNKDDSNFNIISNNFTNSNNFVEDDEILTPKSKIREEVKFYEKKLSVLLEKLSNSENDYLKKTSKQLKTQEAKLTIKEQEDMIEILKKEVNEVRVHLRELHNNKIN